MDGDAGGVQDGLIIGGTVAQALGFGLTLYQHLTTWGAV
jgi:hypothetical protein